MNSKVDFRSVSKFFKQNLMEEISPAALASSSFQKLLLMVMILLAVYIFLKFVRAISTYVFKLVLINSLDFPSFSKISEIRCKSLKFSLKKRKITLKSCFFSFLNHNFSIKKIKVYLSKSCTESDGNVQNCSKSLFDAKIKISGLFIQNFCSSKVETERKLYLNEILKLFFDFLKENHISKNVNGQVQFKIPQNATSNESENGNFIFQPSEISIQSFSYENIFINQNSSENEKMNSILFLIDKMKVLRSDCEGRKLFYNKIKKLKICSKSDNTEKANQTQKLPLIFFSDFLNFDTDISNHDASKINVNLNVGPSFFSEESKLIPQIVSEIEKYFSVKIPILPEQARLHSKSGSRTNKRSPEQVEEFLHRKLTRSASIRRVFRSQVQSMLKLKRMNKKIVKKSSPAHSTGQRRPDVSLSSTSVIVDIVGQSIEEKQENEKVEEKVEEKNEPVDAEANAQSLPPPPAPPPPPPPPPPPAPAAAPSIMKLNKPPPIKTRSVFWKKVRDSRLQFTVWKCVIEGKLDDSFDLDDEELSAFAHIFAQQPTCRARGSFLPGSSSSVVQLLSAEKTKAVGILLSGLKMQPETVLKRVLELDFTAFNESQLQLMLKNAPTSDDYKLIDAYQGDKRRLGVCEKFFMAIRDFSKMNNADESRTADDSKKKKKSKSRTEKVRTEIDKSDTQKESNTNVSESANDAALYYKARVSLMLSLLTSKSTLRTVCEKLQMIHGALSDIRESPTLLKVLACILKLGNILNGGTVRGGAFGFDLSILPKINDIRSTSLPGYTLLNYVASRLVKVKPDQSRTEDDDGYSDSEDSEGPLTAIEGLRCELPNVMLCNKIDINALQTLYKEVSSQFSELKSSMSVVEKKLAAIQAAKAESPEAFSTPRSRRIVRRTSLNPFLIGSSPSKTQKTHEEKDDSINKTEILFDTEMGLLFLMKKFKKHEGAIAPLSEKIQSLFNQIDEDFTKTALSFSGENEVDKETTVASFISLIHNFVIQLEKADDENKERELKEQKKRRMSIGPNSSAVKILIPNGSNHNNKQNVQIIAAKSTGNLVMMNTNDANSSDDLLDSNNNASKSAGDLLNNNIDVVKSSDDLLDSSSNDLKSIEVILDSNSSDEKSTENFLDNSKDATKSTENTSNIKSQRSVKITKNTDNLTKNSKVTKKCNNNKSIVSEAPPSPALIIRKKKRLSDMSIVQSDANLFDSKEKEVKPKVSSKKKRNSDVVRVATKNTQIKRAPQPSTTKTPKKNQSKQAAEQKNSNKDVGATITNIKLMRSTRQRTRSTRKLQLPPELMDCSNPMNKPDQRNEENDRVFINVLHRPLVRRSSE